TEMPVTRLMKVEQMSRYMDEVFRHHAGFGIVLTVPEDRFAFDPEKQRRAAWSPSSSPRNAVQCPAPVPPRYSSASRVVATSVAANSASAWTNTRSNTLIRCALA